jgi:uncharacterized membrane protein
MLALWLIASPTALGDVSRPLLVSDIASGLALAVCSLLAFRRESAAWVACGVGLWVMSAPLVFWARNAAAYNNDTLVGALIVVFAVIVPRLDRHESPTLPPGWSYNPSDWNQRLPIVFLAMIGFLSSRYLAAFQLGHIETVWDPFFGDGTQRVLTSGISEWFPVSDAGLGALSYLLDAIAGLIGGTRRWRTMPWMALLFGFFIIPPGVTSIVLVILQPIGVGAWCTVCLITAVVMLLMVPPALDEVIAATQFLLRVRRAGGKTWRAFWLGEGEAGEVGAPKERSRSRWAELLHGVEIFSTPRTLLLSALAGAWWLAAPAVLGMSEAAAKNDYIVGALVATFAVIAGAEPARAVRFVNVALGAWMLAAPWVLAGGTRASAWSDVAAGVAVILLSLPRGRVDDRYGSWDRWIV